MEHKQAKLSESDIDNLRQFEQSIEHWSTQIVKGLLQIDDMKSTVKSIYLARQQMFEKAYEEAGIDHNDVQHVELMQDGTLNVVLKHKESSEVSETDSLNS